MDLPQVLVAGFNAHGQLCGHYVEDVTSFQPLLTSEQKPHETARVLFTSWSTTIVVVDDWIRGFGHQTFSKRLPDGLTAHLTDAFGGHNGMIGCLDGTGKLYLLDEQHELVCQNDESSPSISHVAMAGNEKTVVTFKQAPKSQLCHVLQFDTVHKFLAWFRDPSGVKLEAEKQHFMLPGRPQQVIANTATFMMLMESGEVYTWGDPRYHNLGRSIAKASARQPGLVDALGGLRIRKIACGGWICAALSEDGALYLWGSGTPGTSRTIRIFNEADVGEVVLVELPDPENPRDVLDVGVGDNHIALVSEDDGLWVVGDNRNGQLGLSHDAPGFVEEWTHVPDARQFQQIFCGPKATYTWTRP